MELALKEYVKQLSRDELGGLALRCETTPGHIKNVMYGLRKCSPLLAVLLERESDFRVTRKILLPDDWERIWPELSRKPHKQKAGG